MMILEKKGQQSVEFLIVVGIAFTMLIPGLYLFSQYSGTSTQIVTASQINRIGREMISQIESMYYYGENSRTTMKVSFPERINEVYLNKKIPPHGNLTEIVFNVSLFGGYSELVYFTRINVTANFTGGYPMKDAVGEGLKTFVIESHGDFVSVQRRIS